MNDETNLDPDYPYIRLWGSFLGSSNEYIVLQQYKAKKTGAPPTALSEHYIVDGQTREWTTIERITNRSTLRAMNALAAHLGWTAIQAQLQQQVETLNESDYK